ncbi:DUF4402 domain-containing protein [Marinagarivorans cellulosilyticus]|uniref:DUF4402 domain-containing protein n=1 Tax=Marinagarivorans cellulosilyticus TaxID=2721545 RepID=A0AAN2BJF0_9GAMM|nr:DUF4402 domain-containing protein [Marinagarivorans cellulosilyticus]BCD96887.1 hypothetical protein MARGE09_P1087 [Marinagarivorans cellulosilyticus]
MKIFIALVLVIPSLCIAAVTEEQAISFGSFAIAANDAQSSIVISKNGGTPVYSYKIYPLMHGQPGQYRLSAYPAFTPLVININDFVLQRTGAPNLLIEDFTHDPIITDGSGEALLDLGASLKTTGLGGSYGDGNYTGTMNITISW